MARPTKQGLDYFPLDVNFLKDIKVRKIKRACGPATIEILLCLLGNIYQDTGYYFGWDEESMFLVADEVGAKEGLVEEVVNKAVQVGFFNQDKFEKYKILTSRGIQNRYREATQKRKGAVISDIYLVIDEFTENKPQLSENKLSNNSINSTVSTQSKVKESKVNKSKVNKNKKSEADVSDQFSEYLKIFSDYTKGIKTQPRIDAMHAFGELHPLQREEALFGAKNYIEWHKQSGEDVKYSKNAYAFLVNLMFTDFQEVPVIPVNVDKKAKKSTKDVPEWSSLNNEPEEVEADW
jgi:Putative replisome organiser protein C-terminus.